jgi:hypothetical protein
MNDFSEKSLHELFEVIQERCTLFPDARADEWNEGPRQPIYLRFDIDDNLRKAVKMADICYSHGIQATFFILNTAKYWNDPNLMRELKYMQDIVGHEIGWHNNILTQWINDGKPEDVKLTINTIASILNRFLAHGIIIRGSASHGDQLCHKLYYLNYEVFKECSRTQEAVNFPPCSFTIPKVSMHDFRLEYEAYHVPYNLYLSESGGKEWTTRQGTFTKPIKSMNDIIDLIPLHGCIQILIHPQHWKI